MGPHDIRYEICDRCKNMEKLSAQDIDKDLIDRDERKPVRKVVDDKLIPAAGVVLGGAAAGVGAIGSLTSEKKLKEVGN